MIVDKTISCRDCGTEFLFTIGEQEFYQSKGFTHEPTRCKDCRQKRRAGSDAGYMGGGSYSAGGYSSYSSGSSYGATTGRREMFTALCSDCGKEARVPFQPRSDKPVYCSDCFENHRSGANASRSRTRY